MLNSLNQYGEKTFVMWLTKLGYESFNGMILSERSRCFMLTFHSDFPLQVAINDTLQNDIEFMSN